MKSYMDTWYVKKVITSAVSSVVGGFHVHTRFGNGGKSSSELDVTSSESGIITTS